MTQKAPTTEKTAAIGHTEKGQFSHGNEAGAKKNQLTAKQKTRDDAIKSMDRDAKLDLAELKAKCRTYATDYRLEMLEHIAGKKSKIKDDSPLAKALAKPNMMAIVSLLAGLDERVNGKAPQVVGETQQSMIMVIVGALPSGENAKTVDVKATPA